MRSTTQVGLVLAVFLATLLAHADVCDRGFIGAEEPASFHPFGLDALAATSLEHVLAAPRVDGDQPLARVVHRIGVAIAGLEPAPHHFAGALLHALTAALLLVALRSLGATAGVALFAALAFGLHPSTVEPVAWISMRARVLAGLFAVCALGLWRTRPWTAALVALFALASHPIAVALPVLFGLFPAPPADGRSRARRLALLVVVLAAAGSLWRAWSAATDAALPFTTRALFSPAGALAQLARMLLPNTLGLPDVHPALRAGGGSEALAVGAWIVLAVLGVLGVRALRNARSDSPRTLVWSGVLWYAFALTIAGLGPYGEAYGPDRDAYLAAPGLFLALGAGIAAILRSARPSRASVSPVRFGAALAVLGLLGLLTRVHGGAWRETRTLAHETLERSPDHFVALRLAGFDALRRGRLTDATEAWERVLALRDQRDADSLFGLGEIDMRRPLPDRAQDRFEAALALDPRHVRANLRLGEALQRRGEQRSLLAAIESFRRASRAAPFFVRPLTRAAVVLATLARAEEAEASARTALRIDPDAREAWLALGIAAETRGDPTGARELYEHALALEPDYAEALTSLGRLEFEAGESARALATLERSYFVHPLYPDTAFQLARAYEGVGQTGRAVEFYERTLEQNPRHMRALVSLAQLELAARRLDGARTWLERALAQNPSHPVANRLAAEVAAADGDWKRAVELAHLAASLDPSNSETTAFLVRMLATVPDEGLRDGAAALSRAERSVRETGGKDPRVLAALATALAEVGRYDDAERRARAALELADEPLRTRIEAEIEHYRRGEPVRSSARGANGEDAGRD